MKLPSRDDDKCLDCRCAHNDCDKKWLKHPYRVAPRVGMGVTMAVGSDRYPGTIMAVSANGKEIIVRLDEFKRTDSNGFSESQTYEFYEPSSPYAGSETFTLRKNGRWVLLGDKMRGGQSIGLGRRDAYWDPSF